MRSCVIIYCTDFLGLVKKATTINSPDAKRMIAFVIMLVGFIVCVYNTNINQHLTKTITQLCERVATFTPFHLLGRQ